MFWSGVALCNGIDPSIRGTVMETATKAPRAARTNAQATKPADKRQSQADQGKEPKNTPVYSKRYWTGAGNIEVSVWENVTGEGDEERVVLSTSLKKTYKSENGYKDSNSFFPQELPLVVFALNEAAQFCFNEQNKK
jgi:hypothetical protein